MEVRNADVLIFEDIELGDRRPNLRDVRSGPTVEEDGKEQGPACNERLAGSHPLLDVQLLDQTRQVCALETETFSRLGLVAARAGQRASDDLSFMVLDRPVERAIHPPGLIRREVHRLQGKVLRTQR